MKNGIGKIEKRIGAVVGFLAYRLLEILDGERLPNIHLIPYRKAQPLKVLALSLIAGGDL